MYTLSNLKIWCDVIAYLRQVAIKRACSIWNRGKTFAFQGYSQWSKQLSTDEITSNLEIRPEDILEVATMIANV